MNPLEWWRQNIKTIGEKQFVGNLGKARFELYSTPDGGLYN